MKRKLLAAPLTVLALVAVGCADDDGDGAATVTTIDTTATTHAATTSTSSSSATSSSTTVAVNEIEKAAIEALEELQSTESVMQAAAGAEGLDRFLEMMNAAGLTHPGGQDKVTLFIPSDSGVQQTFTAPQQEAMEQPDNRDVLEQIVKYHIVPREVTKDDMRDGAELETTAGEPLQLKVVDGAWMVNDEARITRTIRADDGVIHVIDNALVPPGIECC